MAGENLFPLWKRGIKGDLLEWCGGFLRNKAVVFWNAEATREQKISPGPSLPKRGKEASSSFFVTDETLMCVLHAPVSSHRLVGNDELFEGRDEEGGSGFALGLHSGHAFVRMTMEASHLLHRSLETVQLRFFTRRASDK